MLILGINDTHDASACLIKDGELIKKELLYIKTLEDSLVKLLRNF